MISEYYEELIERTLNNTGLEKVIFGLFSEIMFAILTLKFPISACRQLHKIGTETDRNVWIHSPLSKISKTDLKQCLQILL